MQQKILDIMQAAGDYHQITHTQLSFSAFLEYIRRRVKDETSIKKGLFRYVLDRFAEYPELEGKVEIENLSKYGDILDLIYAILSTLTEDEKETYWGMGVPMTPIIFYGTDPFYELLSEANDQAMDCGFGDNNFEKEKHEIFYSFILEKLYGIRFRRKTDLVYNVNDAKTGLTKHYRVNVDTTFVAVTANKPLPNVDVEVIRSYSLSDDALDVLYQILPLDMFSLSGFNIMTITDITTEHALELIKDNIVAYHNEAGDHNFKGAIQSIKEIVGTNEVEFNILPLFKLNGNIVEDIDTYCGSVLFTAGRDLGMSENFCLPLIQRFISNPRLVYFGDLDVEGPSQPQIGKILHLSGIKSYSLLPIYYNKNLVGALELYSSKKGVLNEKFFSLLEPAKNLLAQLVQNSLQVFDEQIATVIKEKFTTIQPAVQWKFNEVAWRYLRESADAKGSKDTEEIKFENVYPLYGAVDIRNSTIERNSALREDLMVQFGLLAKVLDILKEKSGFGLLDEKIFTAKRWIDKLNNSNTFKQEIKVMDFLENEINPFLREFTKGISEYTTIAEEYFSAIDEKDGSAYNNRRQLEQSMTTVISAVNNYFDMLKDEIQQAYPCYFEKFRTDGVEYDIYIGQAITPHKPYSDIYLNNLRLLQLSSMAAIAKYCHSLLPQLPRAVETTQLIFIHSHPIEIRFRKDEKRFDVEGAYNIRYHIVKKRIDKVLIKDSKERLTQPNKIALVYFSQKEADEYITYIKYLQGQKILKNELEYLDLEELQGVSGLKAIRVEVEID